MWRPSLNERVRHTYVTAGNEQGKHLVVSITLEQILLVEFS